MSTVQRWRRASRR